MRQPIRLGAFLPFDSGEIAINPNAGILKISKQISDSYPFKINADQIEVHFTLNQNTPSKHGPLATGKHSFPMGKFCSSFHCRSNGYRTETV